MTTFNLTSGGKTFIMNTDGTVAAATGPVGTWTTNATNQILVKKSAGGADEKIDVGWEFNASNQLCLKQGQQIVFNFTTGVRPLLRLADNILQVRPNPGFSFEFPLQCKWEVDAQINLKVTIGTATSTISGWVDDKKSRFIYWFRDKQGSNIPYALEFSGAWERDTSKPDEIKLIFKFNAAGTQQTFTLPHRAVVNAAQNQLFISYQKDGVMRRIEFRGSVEVSSNLDLIFTIARQTTSNGGVVTQETTIAVAATFEFDNLKGGLAFFVGKTVTDNTQKLVISGQVNVVFGNAGLDLNFNYSKVGGTGQTAVVALALNGKFTWDQGKSALIFAYQRNGQVQTLSLASKFTLGEVRSEIGLNITKDGQQLA